MDLGWELAAILIVVLSLPLMGYVVGTVIGGRRFLRRELWLVVAAAYLWFCVWYALAVIRPSEFWHSLAEHVTSISLMAYPVIGLWYVVNGVLLQHAKWLHATKTCMHCGYDLRGQTIARCPECGQPVTKPPS